MFWESFLCELQSDEIIPEEYEDWLAMEEAREVLEADFEAQDKWYHETFE